MYINPYKIILTVHRNSLSILDSNDDDGYSKDESNYLKKLIKSHFDLDELSVASKIKISSISTDAFFFKVTLTCDKKIMTTLREEIDKEFYKKEKHLEPTFVLSENPDENKLKILNKELDEILTDEDYRLYA